MRYFIVGFVLNDLIIDVETDLGIIFRSLKWKGKGDIILYLSK